MIEKDFVINNFLDRIEKLESRVWEVEKTAWTGEAGEEPYDSVLNVRTFGATGNGSTDDTAAFEAVALALSAAGGGAVYIPEGIYKCTTTITWPYNKGSILIYGDGAKSIVYYTPADGTNCWKIPQFQTGTGAVEGRFIVRDLSMRGAGKLSATGNALYIYNTSMISVDSLTIYDFGGGAGIKNEGGQNVGIYRCFLHENKYGVHLLDAGTGTGDTYDLNSNNVSMRDCQMQHSVSHGVFIEIPSGRTRIIQTVIDNCIIQGNGGSAVYAEDFSFLRLNNLYFESNQTADATLGDIHFEKGYYCDIEHCEDHGSSIAIVANETSTVEYGVNALMGTITLDSNCAYWMFKRLPSDLVNNGNYMIYDLQMVDAHFTDGDTTPTVYNRYFWYADNTSATSITNFDDGLFGQRLTIYFTTANTTIVSGSNIRLAGADSWNPPANAMLELVKFGAYGWVETGRMDPT